MPVIVVGSGFPGNTRLTKRSDKLVAVLNKRTWQLARVKSEEGDNVNVHVMGYQDDPNKDYFMFDQVPKKRVFPLTKEFVPVLVTQDDVTRPAVALKWQ